MNKFVKTKECFFIFKNAEKLEDCRYLTKEKTWSKDFGEVELMSEAEASNNCVNYNASCGSCQVSLDLNS